MQDIPHPPSVAPSRIENLTFGYQIGVAYNGLSEFETGGS